MPRQRVIAATMLAIVAIGAARWETALPVAPVFEPSGARRSVASVPDSASVYGRWFEARDLFGATNDSRPSRRSGWPRRLEVRNRPAVHPVHPSLALKAVAGGPPWIALVDGLPNHPGPTIVRAGDRLGDIVVTAVSRRGVDVATRDTAWALRFTERQ